MHKEVTTYLGKGVEFGVQITFLFIDKLGFVLFGAIVNDQAKVVHVIEEGITDFRDDGMVELSFAKSFGEAGMALMDGGNVGEDGLHEGVSS
jgi:hypothetical protein